MRSCFENFELFCPLGAMKLGVQQKKLLHLIQPSQDPIFFWGQGSRVCVCGRVLSVYGALMLLNFCGDWVKGLGARAKLLAFFKKVSGVKCVYFIDISNFVPGRIS